MNHSQPEGNQDAEGVDVRPVELRDKQISALEALGQSVHSLLDTLLQGECQEVEDLSDFSWLL